MRQTRPLSGRPILLIEDEPRLREMLLQGTREMGFDPTGAPSAEQALRILDRQSFPVAIVNLNLPGIGGLEFLRTLRQRWPDTQAIILTGFGDLRAAREAIHLDVVEFLTKPCALGDLEVAIGRAFNRLQQVMPDALDPVMEPDEEEMDLHEQKSAAWTNNQPDGPPAFAPRDSGQTLSMEDLERTAILATVKKHGGNRAAAADELGISIRKLYYRLGEYKKKGFL